MQTNFKFAEEKVKEKDLNYIKLRLEKIGKLFSSYTPDSEVLCEIEISQDKKNFWDIEIILQTPHQLYRVEKTSQVLTEAFDETEQMLKKQILRDKKRLKDLKERGGRSFKKKVALDVNARF